MIILFSIINGITTGPMWLAICKLVADVCTPENTGFYFSYFFSFYISSMVLACVISSIVFGVFN
jgi:hypothetical protein